MNKTIFIILIFVNTLFASLGTKNDLEVLDKLGLESSFIFDSELIDVYKKYSTKKSISYYRNILNKSSLNAQIVRTEIENENLPEAVFFIPMLESSFINQTKGKSTPAGLWQIMPNTAKHLKLRNDQFIDERLDLLKSTDAASSYLKRYYKKFDKWYLAILSYNCGEGKVIEAMTRASLDRYIELNPNKSTQILKSYQRVIADYQRTKRGISSIYGVYGELQSLEVPFSFEYLVKKNKERNYLPESSLSYIRKIIVFSILADRDLFGNIKKSSYKLAKVKAPKGVHLKVIANAINFNYNDFININKHIKKQILPKDSSFYNIYIPKSKLEIYKKKISSIKYVNEKKDVNTKKKPLIYKVKKGDSLESIAKIHKISVKTLKIDNNKKSNLINIGENIEIYK